MSGAGMEAIEGVVAGSEDADEALRATVDLIAAEPGVAWAAIAFLEQGELTLGPAAGTPDEPRRHRQPVVFQGTPVGELWVDGDVDDAFLGRVASVIAAHVLIGWDTGGEAWQP